MEKAPDLFNCGANLIFNTTNRAGAMGKGLALEFKQRFPLYFQLYRRKIEAKEYPEAGNAYIYPAVFTLDNLAIGDLIVKDLYSVQTCAEWCETAIIDATRLVQKHLPPWELAKNEYTVALPIPGVGAGKEGLANPLGPPPDFDHMVSFIETLAECLKSRNVRVIACHPSFK
jgi:hypothetical protein